MYIETSSGNHGNGIVVSFERTVIFPITNLTFQYNRFSILVVDSLKSMGRFRIQLLLGDKNGVRDITYLRMINISRHQFSG